MLGIAESVIGVAGKVLDKFVGDKDLKVKLEAELNKELISLDLAQAQANIEQAKHPSIFVSGARPAIMWVACLGLFWSFFASSHPKVLIPYKKTVLVQNVISHQSIPHQLLLQYHMRNLLSPWCPVLLPDKINNV